MGRKKNSKVNKKTTNSSRKTEESGDAVDNEDSETSEEKEIFGPEQVDRYLVDVIGYNMKASEPKWVNPNDIWYGVNSHRVRGLHIIPYHIN